MKRKLICMLLGAVLSTHSFASYVQNVDTCLYISATNASNQFVILFRSSDFFDSFMSSSPISYGQSCVSHRYSHGPKNLRFKLETRGRNSAVKIIPDASCSFMHKINAYIYESDYQVTVSDMQDWRFILNQVQQSQDGYYIYSLHCEHWRP